MRYVTVTSYIEDCKFTYFFWYILPLTTIIKAIKKDFTLQFWQVQAAITIKHYIICS
jgi:hypothetical protein